MAVLTEVIPVSRAKCHVKKGDTVLVLSGKYAGKKGKVLTVIPDQGRVVVEGVNIVKKHLRPTPKMQQGGIQEREAPFPACKVMVVCGSCNTPTRVGRKFLADGKKVRYCKKCGEVLDK
ncbi:MAG: 50S ribosomal protein L24 [Clostridia bacterium]|nr:50S ribosomal protein L24 [Clostridia bacterium]